MEITGSAPDRVEIELSFMKPMRSTQQVEFVITPTSGGSDVTWRMSGQHEGLMMTAVQQGGLDGQADRQGLREGAREAEGGRRSTVTGRIVTLRPERPSARRTLAP